MCVKAHREHKLKVLYEAILCGHLVNRPGDDAELRGCFGLWSNGCYAHKQCSVLYSHFSPTIRLKYVNQNKSHKLFPILLAPPPHRKTLICHLPSLLDLILICSDCEKVFRTTVSQPSISYRYTEYERGTQ
jgi:hypothetical protein